MLPELIYSSPFFIAAILIFIVSIASFRRREMRGAVYLALVCLSGAVWAVFEGMLYLGLELETDMLITYAQYLGAGPIVTLGLCFSLTVFGLEHWINRKTIPIFILMPVAILSLAWTDPFHHLVYPDYYLIDSTPVPIRGIERGPLWWIIIGCQYMQATVLSAILVYIVVTSTGVMRAQATVILAAVGIVWLINVIYVTGNSPVPHMDISPLAFILVALSMAWGFFRYHLLDLLPLAKGEIYQGLSDPIVVVDNHHHLMDLNPAAEALLGVSASTAVGRSIHPIIDGRFEKHAANSSTAENRDGLVHIGSGAGKRSYEIHTTPLKGAQKDPIGHIIFLQDVTERRRAQQAQRQNERLQGVLEMAGAACHDLNQPVMAILGYAELILLKISQDNPAFTQTMKLAEQGERLSDITKKLMRITRYATKDHQGQQIIDIDQATLKSEK